MYFKKYSLSFLFALVFTLVSANIAFSGVVLMLDLGEGNYAEPNSKYISIKGSKGTTVKNAVNALQAGGVLELNGKFKFSSTLSIKKALIS